MTPLDEIAEELPKLRRQLRAERIWRRLIAVALVLAVGVGIRAEVVRRDNEKRDERNACFAANDSRAAIRDAFGVLISASLAGAPADDPRRARADAFTADLNAGLPNRDCG